MYHMIEHFCSSSGLLFSTSSRMVLSALCGLLFVLFLGKKYIRFLWHFKIGQPIREGKEYYARLAELHKEKKNTPTMGGVLFLGATLFSMVLWSDWNSPFVRIITLSLLFFTTIGAIDDWSKLQKRSSSGLSAKSRFLLQSGCSFLLIFLMLSPEWIGHFIPKVALGGETLSWSDWNRMQCIPFFGYVMGSSLVGWLCMRLVEWGCLVGTPNAVNLSDGLDGLASGLAVLVAFTFALIAFFSNYTDLSAYHGLAYIESSGEIAVIAAALAGSLIGFLWFNSHPAQLFMGDTGSLGIGSILGTSAFLLHQEWLLFFVGIVFVAEAVSVMIQVASCKFLKRKIFRCTPLHHHFEYAGLHEMKVVFRFWIIGLLAAFLAVIWMVL